MFKSKCLRRLEYCSFQQKSLIKLTMPLSGSTHWYNISYKSTRADIQCHSAERRGEESIINAHTLFGILLSPNHMAPIVFKGQSFHLREQSCSNLTLTYHSTLPSPLSPPYPLIGLFFSLSSFLPKVTRVQVRWPPVFFREKRMIASPPHLPHPTPAPTPPRLSSASLISLLRPLHGCPGLPLSSITGDWWAAGVRVQLLLKDTLIKCNVCLEMQDSLIT